MPPAAGLGVARAACLTAAAQRYRLYIAIVEEALRVTMALVDAVDTKASRRLAVVSSLRRCTSCRY